MSTEHRPDEPRNDAPALLERERLALSLLQRAGRRNAPPADATDRVYAALLDVWSEEVSRRRRLSRRLVIAAAMAVIAVGAAILLWRTELAPSGVARVTRSGWCSV